MDELESKPKAVPSAVGTPAKGRAKPINKDGLVKGQIVEDKDYWAIMSKQRANK